MKFACEDLKQFTKNLNESLKSLHQDCSNMDLEEFAILFRKLLCKLHESQYSDAEVIATNKLLWRRLAGGYSKPNVGELKNLELEIEKIPKPKTCFSVDELQERLRKNEQEISYLQSDIAFTKSFFPFTNKKMKMQEDDKFLYNIEDQLDFSIEKYIENIHKKQKEFKHLIFLMYGNIDTHPEEL